MPVPHEPFLCDSLSSKLMWHLGRLCRSYDFPNGICMCSPKTTKQTDSSNEHLITEPTILAMVNIACTIYQIQKGVIYLTCLSCVCFGFQEAVLGFSLLHSHRCAATALEETIVGFENCPTHLECWPVHSLFRICWR